MANPQNSVLVVKAITVETTYSNFDEIIILDDAGVGFTIADSAGANIVFTGGIRSLHIGSAGKPVNEVTVTPTSGTINIMIYQ